MKLFKKIMYATICAGLLITSIGVQPVYAASIVVNSNADTIANDGFCTLREAIINANNDNQSGSTDCAAGAGTDTITFAANYTITLVGSQLPVITSIIIINGNGVANTIIQANAAPNTATYRVFQVVAGGNLTLDNLTVRHGRCNGSCATVDNSGGGILNNGTLTVTNSAISNNSADTNGGGITNLLSAGTVTVTNSTLSNNSATFGGGIFNFIGTLDVTNSTFSNNTATDEGGGIANLGTGGITNSTFLNNTATDEGGGIYNAGLLDITNSTLSNNNATDGGGISNVALLDITNSTFSNNSATEGGGIYNDGTGTTLDITNSTFSNNSATEGGGIYNDGTGNTLNITNSTFSNNIATINGGGIVNDSSGTLNITNSTLSDNTANNSGGGISNFSGTLDITNSTLSGNSAPIGGGILLNNGTFHYSNTIIANSTSGADCLNFGGTIGTNSNNLVEDGGCATGGVNFQTGDPNLGPLQDNGGPAQTHALLSGSIAIDAGDATICANAPVNNLDQRGVARPIDGDATPGAVCDIGAYEYSSDTTFPTVVFTNLVASYTKGPSSFTLTFSEDVFDSAGNTHPDDVTNPDNYLIVEDGSNNTFNTVSCAGGVAGDDTQVAITSVTYNAGLFTATVNLSAAVPDGNYRLFVCGTTSIADLVLNPLNNGLSDYAFDFVVGIVPTTAPPVTASALPTTGFAPSKVTKLPAQPAELTYNAMGDIWLEIPSQNIKSNIVGIPQSQDNTWDVTWLGNDTGWLNGTAFPTWNGNSVLTAHVTDANGLPGPFANVKELKYGDRIIVHLFGGQYIYEVQNSRMVRPYTTNYAFTSLQDHSYLTLITCQGYIPFSDTYLFRRVVRAVLVEVK